MKKQVVVIHGGNSFATYKEYMSYLMNHEVNLMDLFKRDWKSGLEEALGSEYEVVYPRMPNPQNAKYKEWKIWFEKLIPQFRQGVILVGHSLGGSFLAKYLSEEKFPKGILAVFLVAAPYGTGEERQLTEFTPPDSLGLLEAQAEKIFLYHSTDDPIVSFTEFAKYQKKLKGATPKIFSDRGHFDQKSFPELVEDIRNLQSQ